MKWISESRLNSFCPQNAVRLFSIFFCFSDWQITAWRSVRTFLQNWKDGHWFFPIGKLCRKKPFAKLFVFCESKKTQIFFCFSDWLIAPQKAVRKTFNILLSPFFRVHVGHWPDHGAVSGEHSPEKQVDEENLKMRKNYFGLSINEMTDKLIKMSSSVRRKNISNWL